MLVCQRVYIMFMGPLQTTGTSTRDVLPPVLKYVTGKSGSIMAW